MDATLVVKFGDIEEEHTKRKIQILKYLTILFAAKRKY